eukprot:TRINITY_DN10214_c0_g1_i2.p1 TRINITY_DN10214_c0_g1~~TRINITY_DN10214_c0_g1_i2.p1  ORF type:complete len:192 (-),score=46.80 TRINITY_DN10214_c0_g1_i2:97-672(-)
MSEVKIAKRAERKKMGKWLTKSFKKSDSKMIPRQEIWNQWLSLEPQTVLEITDFSSLIGMHFKGTRILDVTKEEKKHSYLGVTTQLPMRTYTEAEIQKICSDGEPSWRVIQSNPITPQIPSDRATNQAEQPKKRKGRKKKPKMMASTEEIIETTPTSVENEEEVPQDKAKRPKDAEESKEGPQTKKSKATT